MEPSGPQIVSDIPLPVLILSAVCLITLSMLFSISESAFLSMNKLRLRMKCKKGERRALRVSKLLKRRELMINTLLVANDLVNVLLSSILTVATLKMFGEKGIGIATAITTVLLLIFGEITPKAISTRHPDPIAYHLSFFVRFVVAVLHPVIIVFTWVSRIVLKVRGVKLESNHEHFTEEEIKTIFDVSAESGVLDKNESAAMNRVFKFNDLEARDIMTPRTKLICVQENSSYDQIIELSQKTRLSRFPVYRENIDDITGTVYVKDLLAYSASKETFSLKKVMRPPLFILGTKKMSSVQQMLRENRQTMAIVVDEYSGTDGVLTKIDIAYEMLGTAVSEFKKMSNAQISSDIDEKDFMVHGTCRLMDLKELLHINLESETSETLGGWIFERLDRLAAVGDKIEFEGFCFEVERIERHRIEDVHVTQILSEGEEDD